MLSLSIWFTLQADTNGAGLDIIIEMLANVNLQRDLDLLARHGRVIIVGNRGTIEINPRATMAKETSIIGCMLWQNSEVSYSMIDYITCREGMLKNVLQCIISGYPDTLCQWKHIRFWLSVSGNSSEKLRCGNVVIMPYRVLICH